MEIRNYYLEFHLVFPHKPPFVNYYFGEMTDLLATSVLRITDKSLKKSGHSLKFKPSEANTDASL